jgi:tetratricopeptide (TPR) repeat protein
MLAVMLGVGVGVGYGQGASSLVGKWVPEGVGTTRGFPDEIELMKDGTCILEIVNASWKTSGERLFFMNIGGKGFGMAYNYKVSNSALVLIDDDGSMGKYRKYVPGGKLLPTREEQEKNELMNTAKTLMQGVLERGHGYRRNGMYDKAIEDYTEVIKYFTDSPAGYVHRGLVYRRFKKDYDRAIADFTIAIKLTQDNDNETLYNERGYAYLEKGDYDKALADFNQAVRLYPNSANAYDSRGEAYLTAGDYDNAIADYSQALRLDPNMDSAKKGLAEAKKKKQGR